jgi:sulfide:quinone oxidoreductase
MSHFRSVTPSFAASPQISLDDVAIAARDGFQAIVCNRPDGEDAGQLPASDVAAACAIHGVQFTHIPVVGGINQTQVDQMCSAIEAAQGPVLAYCRSGTRSTNLWAIAMATNGEPSDALIQAAAQAGYDLSGLLPTLNRIADR